MTIAKLTSKVEVTEKEIAKRIVEAGVGLRFDKVAVRFLESVRAGLAQVLLANQSIAFTVTAPIKLPARTSAALREWLPRVRTDRCSTTINGNQIRARLIDRTKTEVPKVIGFVHNPESNADLALDIVEISIREQWPR